MQGRLANGLRVVLRAKPGVPLTNLSVVYDLPRAPVAIPTTELMQVLVDVLPSLGTRHLSKAARQRLLLAADTAIERTRAVLAYRGLGLTTAIPADTLPLALFIEADRMGFGADTLVQADVDDALQRLRTSTSIELELLNAWLDVAVLGGTARCLPTLDAPVRVTAADVQDYARRYLQPANATLIIDGDFELRDAWLTIERTFGNLRGMQSLPQRAQTLPTRSNEQEHNRCGERSRFLLSWQSTDCAAPDECPLAAFAHWLGGRLSQNSRESCVRAWAAQSLGAPRFSIGCEMAPGFDRVRWLQEVDLEIHDFVERVHPAESLQLAAQRYAVDTLSSLELPEQRAAAIAQQVQHGHLPTLLHDTRPLASVATASLRELVKQHLLRSADSAIELGGGNIIRRNRFGGGQPVAATDATATESYRIPDPPHQLSNADDPVWYRPPRKGKPTQVVLPKVTLTPVTGNLVLRHLTQPEASLERVLLRLLLRDSSPDIALSKVAVHLLLAESEGHRTLVNRLWNNCAVRLTLSAQANSIALSMKGTQQGIGLALRQVRQALAAAPRAPAELVESAKQAALAEQGVGRGRSLLEQAQWRLGTSFSSRSGQTLNADLQSRIRAITPEQLAAFWSALDARGEITVSWAGRASLADAQRAALSLMPAFSPRRPAAPRSPTRLRPRIWILDDARTNVDVEVLWPSYNRHPALLRERQLLAGIARAAKELGNLNAARPHNPSTQFTLEHRSLADADVHFVSVQGVEIERLATVLRELDGYFSRLVERVDFAQLSRLGGHDLQRRQLAWFATPADSMALLDHWTLGGESTWYMIDEFENIGSVRRERLLAAAHALSPAQATIIAKGPAPSIESTLRAANPGECVVVPP